MLINLKPFLLDYWIIGLFKGLLALYGFNLNRVKLIRVIGIIVSYFIGLLGLRGDCRRGSSNYGITVNYFIRFLG